jgi:hypothetical protein
MVFDRCVFIGVVLCLGVDASAQVNRVIEMPNKVSIGQIRVVHSDKIRRIGLAEYLQLRDASLPGAPLGGRSLPLMGVIALPADSQFEVLISDAGPLAIDSKIKCLRALDAKAVAALSFRGEVSGEALQVIGEMKGLVALNATAEYSWGTSEGAITLSRLKALRWIQFGRPDGEKHLCGSAIIDSILSLPKLVSLELPSDGFSESELVRLATHPTLESIYLPSFKGNLGDEGFRKFLATPKLRELLVACDESLSNEAVLMAGKAAHLERLVICTEAKITCQRQVRRLRPVCSVQIRGLDD